MCLAIPGRIEKVQIEGRLATVNIQGVKRDIGLTLLPDARVGDYVLVHAGFAIQRVDEEEAEETLKLLQQMASLARVPSRAEKGLIPDKST